MEAMEKDRAARSQFRGGSSAIAASVSENPVVVAAKLQALSPKYQSAMNHIRIHLPEVSKKQVLLFQLSSISRLMNHEFVRPVRPKQRLIYTIYGHQGPNMSNLSGKYYFNIKGCLRLIPASKKKKRLEMLLMGLEQ